MGRIFNVNKEIVHPVRSHAMREVKHDIAGLQSYNQTKKQS
jgi:hypothetical protein